MAISCQTSKIAEPVVEIPILNDIRPSRPFLDKDDNLLTNFYKMGGYTKKLEIYANSLESYIESLKEVFKK